MDTPDLPNIDQDRTFSVMHNLPGPDEMMKLSVAASEQVRNCLRPYLVHPSVLDQIRFESLIMPYMFEARRIGDARGRAREQSLFAGLFPGTE